MGVIDQGYVDATRDFSAIIGRKVPVGADEILEVVAALKVISQCLFESLREK